MLFGQKSFVQKASGQSGEEVSLQMQQRWRQETGQIWFKKEKGQIRFLDFFPLKKLETKLFEWQELYRSKHYRLYL